MSAKASTIPTEEQMAAQTRAMNKTFGDFVKLTDVKEIVNEITMPMISQLRAKEHDVVQLFNAVALLKSELKKQASDTRSALLLKNNVFDNSKFIKQCKSDLAATDMALSNMGEQLDMKYAKVQEALEDNKREMTKQFDVSHKRNENYLDLNEQFHKATHDTTKILTKFKTETQQTLVEQD